MNFFVTATEQLAPVNFDLPPRYDTSVDNDNYVEQEVVHQSIYEDSTHTNQTDEMSYDNLKVHLEEEKDVEAVELKSCYFPSLEKRRFVRSRLSSDSGATKQS